MRLLKTLATAAALVVTTHGATAQDTVAGNAWKISLGGKLYDNQWVETGIAPPETRQPLYPAGPNIEPANTWRCVSCHGWDYRGRNGHLGQLSQAKAFVSLRKITGRPVGEIARRLRQGLHAEIVKPLALGQIDALALFVSVGQFDVAALLDNGRAKGETAYGKDIFEGACMSCHQADGKAYIEGESGDKAALGWIANNKPQQALHKIVNGVPGADMVSMRFLRQAQLADLMAYLQTLDSTPEQ